MSTLTAAPTRNQPYRCAHQLDNENFALLRRRMVLHGFKWDPQVGDVATIAPFPIILSPERWCELRSIAENLAAELTDAEMELLQRPDLHKQLALPRTMRRVLRNLKRQPLLTTGRIRRFDFHWTNEGWRISEVNSDVPGGFTEAWNLPKLMAAHYPNLCVAGNPGAAWVDAIAAAAKEPHIALLSAAGFMEDQQIMVYLASLLSAKGFCPHLVGLHQLVHKGDAFYLRLPNQIVPLGGIIRFYQAEWLAAASWRSCWSMLFDRSQTPVFNPGFAALTESKRFPLVWNDLSTLLPTWRAMLPETRDPQDAPWLQDDSWLVKSAFCNTGDTVAIQELMPATKWQAVAREIRRGPSRWIAQRRFSVIPLETPAGPAYPCIGVYTLDAQAVGIYGRLTYRPVVDFSAVDVAVLIEDHTV